VWAIRHPASGYVQGINDLATPFYQVFLSAYIGTRNQPSCRAALTLTQTLIRRTLTPAYCLQRP
jgi:hypothetical protein